MEAKFFAKDFVGNKLPAKVGQKAKVKSFFGATNVPVVVTEIYAGFVFAKVA